MTTRLATVCARAGSKGIPDKNLQIVAGKSLLAWTLDLIRRSELFDCVAVDSDSSELLDHATALGADYAIPRPAELATDTAGKLGAIQHAAVEAGRLAGCTFDTLVDLDLTSPLRLVEDVTGAIELLEKGGAGNVITGCVAHRSPYFNLVERDRHGRVSVSKQSTQGIVRRQDSPECFDMNASIYVWHWSHFVSEPYLFDENTELFEMPRERSFDIDEPFDSELVAWLLERRSSETP